MHTVMIVDDEATIREKLPKLVNFEAFNFRVCATAKNGAEALELMERHRPDLVLLDMRMPVMDGLSFLAHFTRQQWQDTSVIILSGYSDFEYARQAMGYGAKGYLTKPVDVQEAGKCLRSVAGEIERHKREKRQKEYLAALAELRKAENAAEDVCHTGQYFVLHILPRAEENRQTLPRQVIAETMARCLKLEGGAIFDTMPSFVHSYLVPLDLAAADGGTVEALVRFIGEALEQSGLGCVLMWDTHVLGGAKPFIALYKEHLEQLLRVAFYTGQAYLDWDALPLWPWPAEEEQVGVILDSLRAAVNILVDEDAFAALNLLCDCVRAQRFGMGKIDEIDASLHYALTNALGGCLPGKQPPPALERRTWGDGERFYGVDTWCENQKKKLADTLAYLHQCKKPAGVGEDGGWLHYVERHYREPLTLAKLAERFHMNPAYLGRMFQKAVGTNFKQYITRLRIAEAKRLLRTTDKFIYQISDELGFTESTYFITKFTQEEGMSPSEYRRK